jgi:hypothetical protein
LIAQGTENLHAENVTIRGRGLHSEANPEDVLVLPKSGVRIPKSVQVNAQLRQWVLWRYLLDDRLDAASLMNV